MDRYIVDAVAFLAYLVDKLPQTSDNIFKKAEENKIKLILPSIALGETLYTIYKGKEIFGKNIPIEKIELIFEILQKEEYIELIGMNIDIWRIFHKLILSEMHDRMIVATFEYCEASAIITNDPEISNEFNTVW